MPRSDLLAAGILEESALREVLAERARPDPDARTRLINLAVSYARSQLRSSDHPDVRHPLAALHAYSAALRRPESRLCARTRCASQAAPGRLYCSGACRQAAYRERHAP
jgi:hypothetical protein